MTKIRNQTLLQKVSEEVCHFIYKNYSLDEISNGKDALMYCHHDSMIVTIHNAQTHFDFLFVFSKAECDRLKTRHNELPPEILSDYEPIKKSVKHGNSNWSVRVSVCDMKSWEFAKQLMLTKMPPNRTPGLGQRNDCEGTFSIGLPFGMHTAADTLTYGLLPFIVGQL